MPGGSYWDSCDVVLWVVPRESLAKTIRRELDKSDRGKAEHNFVLLDPIYEMRWLAPVFLGTESGKSINEPRRLWESATFKA